MPVGARGSSRSGCRARDERRVGRGHNGNGRGRRRRGRWRRRYGHGNLTRARRHVNDAHASNAAGSCDFGPRQHVDAKLEGGGSAVRQGNLQIRELRDIDDPRGIVSLLATREPHARRHAAQHEPGYGLCRTHDAQREGNDSGAHALKRHIEGIDCGLSRHRSPTCCHGRRGDRRSPRCPDCHHRRQLGVRLELGQMHGEKRQGARGSTATEAYAEIPANAGLALTSGVSRFPIQLGARNQGQPANQTRRLPVDRLRQLTPPHDASPTQHSQGHAVPHAQGPTHCSSNATAFSTD